MKEKVITPFQGIFKSIGISFKQFTRFFLKPEYIHKQLLEEAENSNEDFIPILINPFDPMLLVKDVGLIHHILKDIEYQNRSGFPIIDYIYFKFIGELNKLKGIKPQLSQNMGGITFANGNDWKRNRRIGLDVMNDPMFLEYSIEPILKSTDKMITSITKNNEVKINKEIGKLGIDIVGKLVFGTNLNMFGGDLVSQKEEIDSQKLGESVRIMLDAIQKFIYYPFPSYFYNYIKFMGIKNLDNSVHNLALTGSILLNKVKKELRENSDKNSNKCLAAIIFENYPELDDIEIQALLMDLLGAGHDTTANLVNFTLSLILEHGLLETSEDFKKEISSISEILPAYKNNNEKINYRTIMEKIEKDSPIMSSIINESLRLYPLGAVFSRISLNNKEHNIKVNNKTLTLKPKSKLLISPYVTGQLKKDWGDTHSKFDPFRFFEIEKKSNAFIPFGSGKRSCIGGRFGILESKLILFRILSKCKIKKGERFKPTDSILAFTLRIKNDLSVIIN